MKILRILSKVAGFRRAGIAHPDTPMIYPADRFSEGQLEQLKGEPKLDVIETEGGLPEGFELPKDGIPEAELKAQLEALKPGSEEGKKTSTAKAGAKT